MVFKLARSEFRYNKNRRHYSYLYRDKGDFRYNLLISTKSYIRVKKKIKKDDNRTALTRISYHLILL